VGRLRTPRQENRGGAVFCRLVDLLWGDRRFRRVEEAPREASCPSPALQGMTRNTAQGRSPFDLKAAFCGGKTPAAGGVPSPAERGLTRRGAGAPEDLSAVAEARAGARSSSGTVPEQGGAPGPAFGAPRGSPGAPGPRRARFSPSVHRVFEKTPSQKGFSAISAPTPEKFFWGVTSPTPNGRDRDQGQQSELWRRPPGRATGAVARGAGSRRGGEGEIKGAENGRNPGGASSAVPSQPARRPQPAAEPARRPMADQERRTKAPKFNGKDSWTWSFRISAWAVSEDLWSFYRGPAGARPGADGDEQRRSDGRNSSSLRRVVQRPRARRPHPAHSRVWGGGEGGASRTSRTATSHHNHSGTSRERHGTGCGILRAAATRGRIIIDRKITDTAHGFR